MSNPIVRKDTTSQPAAGAIFAYDATAKTWDEVVATGGSAIDATYSDTAITFAVNINGETDTVITASDEILFADASDSNNIKKDTVQGILDLAGGNTIYSADDTITASRTVTVDAAKDLSVDITGTGNFIIKDGGTATATFADGGNVTLAADLAVNGGDITTTSTGTATVFNTNATTLNVGGAATTVSIGAATGTATINNAETVIAGNLTVQGTTTTVESTTVTVDDKNIELGSVATPTDVTADGGGITLKGATDKTFNWVNSTDAWTSSENLDLAAGKTLRIQGGTSGGVTIDAPATVTSFTLTLPDAAPSSNGQVLSSTTAGDTSWVSVATAPASSTKTTAYTITDSDDKILLNSTTALITLPDPTTLTAGKEFTITQIAATPTTAGVDTATAATISGSASYVFTTQYESITVYTDGTQFYLK